MGIDQFQERNDRITALETLKDGEWHSRDELTAPEQIIASLDVEVGYRLSDAEQLLADERQAHLRELGDLKL